MQAVVGDNQLSLCPTTHAKYLCLDRIEQQNAKGLEAGHVSGDNRQAMDLGQR